MTKRLHLLTIPLFFLLFSTCVFAQQTITGILHSSAGEPLGGATITVKGTNRSTTTNVNCTPKEHAGKT